MSDPLHQISAQSNFLVGEFLEYAQPRGGTALAVSNLRDMWGQASGSSQVPTIYVCWTGETPRSGRAISALTHRVDRSWVVGVKRGRGFNAVRGDSLNKTVGNAIPFYDVIEDIRDIIRKTIGLSEEFGNDYVGCRPWQLGNLVMDGMLLDFTTANDLPTVLTTPEQPPANLINA